MNKLRGYLIFILSFSFMLDGCKRNDDEPVLPLVPISRLYVSFSDVRTDDTQDPYRNLAIIDPADSAVMKDPYLFNSGVIGGSGVHFDPFLAKVIQASYTDLASAAGGDTTIQMITIGNQGIPGTPTTIGFGGLTGMRHVWYHQPSENLYVINGVTPTAVFAFNKPERARGFVKPSKRLFLGNMRPWGAEMWEDNLIVSRTDQGGSISVFQDISQADTLVENFTPQSTITVEGAVSLRGFAFSEELDLLVLADYNTDNVDGKIYIIENAKNLFAQASITVTPTRTISGSNTELVGPIDIAVDSREGKHLIYVADKAARKVLRFKLSDKGNVVPESTISFQLRPEAIFLDARGVPAQ